MRQYDERQKAEGNKSTEHTAQTPHSQKTPTAIQEQIYRKLSGGAQIKKPIDITPRGMVMT